MKDRSITIAVLNVSGGKHGENEVLVYVSHSKESTNWYSGGTSPSGYFVYTSPRERTEGGFRTVLGSGFKARLQPGDRYSAKTLLKIAESEEAKPSPTVVKLVAKTLESHGLKLDDQHACWKAWIEEASREAAAVA